MIDPPGREEAFRALVFRTYRLVLWHFVQKGARREDAEDLAQDTFLAAFRGLERFRGETGSRRWLLTIADNRWRNWVRHNTAQKRAAREVSLDSGPERQALTIRTELVDGDALIQGTLDSERIAIVRRVIEDLPTQMRHCATLRLLQGLSYREVAATLGISVQSVKVQLFRARKRLRSQLHEHLNEPVRGGR